MAGFCLGASLLGHFSATHFLGMLIGSSLVIACGCAINNYIDRRLDAKMSRTKKRALVTGEIGVRAAITYGALLGLVGFVLLWAFTNTLTLVIGATGLFFYLVMYGVFKRRSPWGTIVGSVSGATPIAAGYTAASGHFDAAALILFTSMVLWQMPHFYGIAMYRFEDYKRAGLPVLPVARGMRRAKLSIIGYVIAFTAVSTMLTSAGYTHFVYLLVMVLIGLTWLYKGFKFFGAPDDIFGRKMFLFSLIVLLVFSAMTAIGSLLP
jgi:protoheme IX farnesyltransferase